MRFILIIQIILINSFTFAQSREKYNNLIKIGENLAYNFQFDSCETIIAKAIELEPSRPEAFLLKSKLHLWFYLGSKDKNEYDQSLLYSDTVITIIDSLLDESYGNDDLFYYLGNVYKLRAMAYGTNGNTLDAFWSTKKAVSYYEKVIEIDSNYFAAYGGIGIFEYVLSYVPALFTWALALSGLTADQNNGFNYIELAAEKASIDKVEYKYHLSKLYDEYLAEFDKSLEIIIELLFKYPNNQLFHYQAAVEYIKLKNLDLAISELEIVQRIQSPKFVQTLSFSDFLLGDIYFRKNDYKRAIEYYKAFLTSTHTIDYTGIASLRIAYCYYFLDNKSEFKRYLFLASNGNLDLEEDELAKEISLNIFKKGMTPIRKKSIQVKNYFLGGDYDAAWEIISTLSDSLGNDDIEAQIIFYRSSILIAKDSLSEAEIVMQKIHSMNLDVSSWIIPMTYFNLAKINYLRNDYIKALNYLDLSEDHNDYQKKKEIQSYINGLRKRIEHD